MAPMYTRPQYRTLHSRLKESRGLIQILAGPRQSGKSTIAYQLSKTWGDALHYATADEPALKSRAWIEQQWEAARSRASGSRRGAVLILDEIQKIPGWSETIKRFWDAGTRKKEALRVVLLGSSPLLVQKGLSESLAGRFELIRVPHWSYAEMKAAFGWNLEEYVYYGGYPGSAPFLKDAERWREYVVHSLVETTISRDILLMTRVDKPALLRQLFLLGCSYSGQIISYHKLVGQLQDAGNTTTLAHYLELLEGAGMLTGLQKYSGKELRQRGSSPKLLVLNTALMSVQTHVSFAEARGQPDLWGRLVESAVGAHLVNTAAGTDVRVSYWRESDAEVDYVLQKGKAITAIEVKSGRTRERNSGVERFGDLHRPKRTLLIGSEGIPLAEFLSKPAQSWVG